VQKNEKCEKYVTIKMWQLCFSPYKSLSSKEMEVSAARRYENTCELQNNTGFLALGFCIPQ